MDETNQILLDRESLLSLRSLVKSMTLGLRGVEARFSKELEMISAISALAARVLDLIDSNLDEQSPD